MRIRKPAWLTASAVAFLVPSLLVGFATVALAASTTALPGDPTKGQTVFSGSTCSTCHGSTLGGGVGPPLHPIKNLGNTKDPLDPTYLISTITNGINGAGGYGQMPAKGGDGKLSGQDIKDLAAFIIQQNQLKGPVPLSPGDLAKSTIMWVTIGILAMLFFTYLLSQYNMRWIARKSGHR
ncbi:MAG TPA: cytochrome c [Candidatus Dormibacteraeota bacterium]|nr:cytochrome c [Candidatus Dormibacteraeota bacterium]